MKLNQVQLSALQIIAASRKGAGYHAAIASGGSGLTVKFLCDHELIDRDASGKALVYTITTKGKEVLKEQKKAHEAQAKAQAKAATKAAKKKSTK